MATSLNIVVLGVSLLEGMAGTSRVANLLKNFPDKEEHSFYNLIFSNTGDNSPYEVSEKNKWINHKIICYNKINPISFIQFYLSGLKYLNISKTPSRKNILFVYGYPNILNFPFILISRLNGFKVVFDIVEDNSVIRNRKNISSRIKVYSSNVLFKNIAFFATGCITISRHLYQKTKTTTKNKVPLVLIPISFDPQILEYNQQKKDSEIVIFYGGSFGEKDGISVLIGAFKALVKNYSQIKLVLTGKPSREDKKQLLLLKDNELGTKINYLGFLDKKSYYQTLLNSDIHCMLRIDTEYSNAGFPFKLGEMLCTGKPVIATKVGDVPYYLTHDVNAYLIEPGSMDQLVQALESLLINPNLRDRLGNAGKKLALKEFDSFKTSKILRDFLIGI